MFLFPPSGISFPSLEHVDDDDDRPTWPPVGSATLKIIEECDALFYSATWVIRARVNNEVMAESEPSNNQRSPNDIKAWAKDFIVKNYKTLKEKGVDAEAEYIKKWGGSPFDF